MFPNSQPMEGVNLADVFAGMLQEIPWNMLRNCVQANARIHKRCTAGGHRLETRWRQRIEKIFVQEAEREDFPDSLCSTLFACWYPQQKELYEQMEEYFHSDEYKAYREKHEIEEGKYVLPDQRFEELFRIADLQKWRTLLCFSPLQFTEEQACRIVDDSQGNTELLETVEKVQRQRDEKDSELARLNNELNSARTRLEQLAAEVQELRRLRRELKSEAEAARKKADSAQQDSSRLRRQAEAGEDKVAQARQEAKNELLRKTKVLSDEVERRSREQKNWQDKYEKQHRLNRELQDKIQKTEKILAEQRIANDKNRKEIKRIHQFIDMLLERFDWAEIGRQIKLTPQLKLRFNTLIRNLHYDEENRPKFNLSLLKFWETMQEQERRLIESIANSDTYEVETGDVEGYWRDLEDTFEDVQIGLESRTILVQLIHEICYQTLELKDLQKDTVPAAMARSKKSS